MSTFFDDIFREIVSRCRWTTCNFATKLMASVEAHTMLVGLRDARQRVREHPEERRALVTHPAKISDLADTHANLFACSCACVGLIAFEV